jgi:large subunit ribosomal protein L10
MSKPVKDLVTKEITQRFGSLDSIVVVNPIGLNAKENTMIRTALRAKKIEMEVVKNSLAKRALVGTKLEGIDKILDGSSALVTGGDSIVDCAREVMVFVKKYPKLKMVGAVVECQVVDAKGCEVLATMPSRAELQGSVVMLAKSPGSRLASAIGAPAGRIAGCIKSLVEKLEKESESSVAA